MIKLTEDEKVILRNIDKRYRWIARDENGELMVYSTRPLKDRHITKKWRVILTDEYELMHIFNHLFQFIKWEDEKPYLIEDLLEGETEK